MRTREWESIERRASLDAFILWLMEQPEDASWSRGDICCCPLHDFIEDTIGDSLAVNYSELSEHWAERESQRWPTPHWMSYLMLTVDETGEGSISKDEMILVLLVSIERNFWNPIITKEEFLLAA